MASLRFSSIPSFFVFFFFLVSPSSADMAFIQKLCTESSIHVDFCITTLSIDRVSLSCQTMECVTAVAVDHAYKNATDVINYTMYLLTRSPTAEIASQIMFCMDLYYRTRASVKMAVEFVKTQDYGEAWKYLGVTDYEGCEGRFPTHPSPMAEANERFGEMLDVAWEMVDRFVTLPPTTGGRHAGRSGVRGRRP